MQRKKILIITSIAVLVILVVIAVHYVSNYKQYQKYCEGQCESKFVSNELLDSVITTRLETEEKQILTNQRKIERDIFKLENSNLNEEEQSKYESYTINPEFDLSREYDIDQIIEFSNTYDKALENYDNLVTANQTRELKDKISDKQKEIAKTRSEIEKFNLTESEQSDYQNLIEEYNQIDYDANVDYTVPELNLYLSNYGLSAVNFENFITYYKTIRK